MSPQRAAMWTNVVQVSVRVDVKAGDDVLVGRTVDGELLHEEGGSPSPSSAGGLALLADRWLVDISPQFVLPGSPASSHICHPPAQEWNQTSSIKTSVIKTIKL